VECALRLGKNSLHTRLISIYRQKTKIKKDIYPQMPQMSADKQEESLIFLISCSSAFICDICGYAFFLAFISCPASLARHLCVDAPAEGGRMPKRIPPYGPRTFVSNTKGSPA
jgi:hypothetical protein